MAEITNYWILTDKDHRSLGIVVYGVTMDDAKAQAIQSTGRNGGFGMRRMTKGETDDMPANTNWPVTS